MKLREHFNTNFWSKIGVHGLISITKKKKKKGGDDQHNYTLLPHLPTLYMMLHAQTGNGHGRV